MENGEGFHGERAERGRHLHAGGTIRKQRHRGKGLGGTLWASYRELTAEDGVLRREVGGVFEKGGLRPYCGGLQ